MHIAQHSNTCTIKNNTISVYSNDCISISSRPIFLPLVVIRMDLDVRSLDLSEGDKREVYKQKLQAASIIARPIAGRKLNKRILKLVKHSVSHKGTIRGVKNTVKAVRKGATGLVVIGGNITPIDTISHVPVYLEEQKIPYIYVPCKEDIGNAFGSQLSTCMVIVQPTPSTQDEYERVVSEINELPKPI